MFYATGTTSDFFRPISISTIRDDFSEAKKIYDFYVVAQPIQIHNNCLLYLNTAHVRRKPNLICTLYVYKFNIFILFTFFSYLPRYAILYHFGWYYFWNARSRSVTTILSSSSYFDVFFANLKHNKFNNQKSIFSDYIIVPPQTTYRVLIVIHTAVMLQFFFYCVE